jgi:hypothetical protein
MEKRIHPNYTETMFIPAVNVTGNLYGKRAGAARALFGAQEAV